MREIYNTYRISPEIAFCYTIDLLLAVSYLNLQMRPVPTIVLDNVFCDGLRAVLRPAQINNFHSIYNKNQVQ